MIYRKYGPKKINLSVIGLGGIVVKDTNPFEAEEIIKYAHNNGVNYFDVAPGYGNAQELMGPGIEDIRSDIFLACKTNKRDKENSKIELEDSLKKLRTNYFDLYQLHGMKTQEDFNNVSSKNGALETLFKAKEQGIVKHVGFSCHSVSVADKLIDNFDFDSILFPVNWALILKHNFGTELLKKCEERDISVLALKCMANELWPDNNRGDFKKCWYKPLTDKKLIKLAIKFTLSKNVISFLPPGNTSLFKTALEIVKNDLDEISNNEIEILKKYSESTNAIGSSEEVFI
tara:strand:- start:105 stop:968 length:864 start_codon:yes stop_codon:yes gene_type:complete